MTNSPARSSFPSLAFLALFGAAFACAHPQPVPEPAVDANVRPATVVLPPAPVAMQEPAAPPAAPMSGSDQLDAALRGLREGSVHFEFDRSALAPDAQERLAVAAEVLRKNPTLAVRVEGNCDERGSVEYNLALGQRRADAAKAYLVRMGAASGQVKSISWGSERSLAAGHDEASWAQNRRDDVLRSALTGASAGATIGNGAATADAR